MNSAPVCEEGVAALRQPSPIEGLYKLSVAVNRSERLEEIYRASTDALRSVLGADRASILLYDAGQVMRFVAWHNLSEGYRQAVDGHSPWTPDSENPSPILIADVSIDPGVAAYRPTFEQEGIRALGFIPLLYRSRLLGKFMVYFDEPHSFTSEEEKILQ